MKQTQKQHDVKKIDFVSLMAGIIAPLFVINVVGSFIAYQLFVFQHELWNIYWKLTTVGLTVLGVILSDIGTILSYKERVKLLWSDVK